MSDMRESVKGEIARTRSSIRQLIWNLIEIAPEFAYMAVMEDVNFMFTLQSQGEEIRKAG
jgi:hypothetical protein